MNWWFPRSKPSRGQLRPPTRPTHEGGPLVPEWSDHPICNSILHYESSTPTSHSRASLTVIFTVKSGNPPEAGKIWENQFFAMKTGQHTRNQWPHMPRVQQNFSEFLRGGWDCGPEMWKQFWEKSISGTFIGPISFFLAVLVLPAYLVSCCLVGCCWFWRVVCSYDRVSTYFINGT